MIILTHFLDVIYIYKLRIMKISEHLKFKCLILLLYWRGPKTESKKYWVWEKVRGVFPARWHLMPTSGKEQNRNVYMFALI